jgi:hypothetical protein
MIVVLADRRDAGARAFVEASAGEAQLLTARDLSEPGWCHRPTGGEDVAVIGGLSIAPREITAVLTRIPGVAAETLPHIEPAERGFIAAEMNAFLLSWLSRLECPVVNRPTAGSLMGPAWSRERWLVEGCRVGFEPFARTLPVPLPTESCQTRPIVLVGDACIGDASSDVGKRARALAERASVTLLGLCLDEHDRLVAIEPWPDIARPKTARLLLSLLRGVSGVSAVQRGAA